MKYKVMYTAGAKKDLRNIFRYISEELLAPENAAGQTERIMTAIRFLYYRWFKIFVNVENIVLLYIFFLRIIV